MGIGFISPRFTQAAQHEAGCKQHVIAASFARAVAADQPKALVVHKLLFSVQQAYGCAHFYLGSRADAVRSLAKLDLVKSRDDNQLPLVLQTAEKRLARVSVNQVTPTLEEVDYGTVAQKVGYRVVALVRLHIKRQVVALLTRAGSSNATEVRPLCVREPGPIMAFMKAGKSPVHLFAFSTIVPGSGHGPMSSSHAIRNKMSVYIVFADSPVPVMLTYAVIDSSSTSVSVTLTASRAPRIAPTRNL
eukprot:CAMPEP_0119199182 /NCGR_PEP_ID=MMETSP1316-20130426/21853_1 /TAXON_ID=41880 /ORGANISM="Pycnococcus provasolii, Strain RCC2336" /LENGTH=245 /DNA_ID=CAMNT_0007195173 /DNA_START=46 /DNA_END=783 /DNA_ORIENTATION=-